MQGDGVHAWHIKAREEAQVASFFTKQDSVTHWNPCPQDATLTVDLFSSKVKKGKWWNYWDWDLVPVAIRPMHVLHLWEGSKNQIVQGIMK